MGECLTDPKLLPWLLDMAKNIEDAYFPMILLMVVMLLVDKEKLIILGFVGLVLLILLDILVPEAETIRSIMETISK